MHSHTPTTSAPVPAPRRSARATIMLGLALVLVWAEPGWAQQAKREAFRVAAVQFNPRLGVLGPNVEALAERFEEAARNGAKIVVAPEMATTGYLYRDRADVAPVVETIPGPTTKRFAEIAREYECYLAWGMPERDGETGLFYNAATLVGPDGFVGKYRKTHLWESEAHWSAWGDLGVPVFETRYGRVALLVCQDANYVETFRLAALRGADVVCFSTNSSGQTIGHLQARAVQNGVYVVSANRSDSEVDRYNGKPFHMKGCSAVWSPAGRKLAEAGVDGRETVYATVDPAEFRTRAERLGERRPELYKPLARHVAPWNSRATTEPRSIEAVAVQYRPRPGQVAANRRRVERMLAARLRGRRASCCDATDPPARLIVLPELSLVGRVDPKRMPDFAEERDGPSARWAAGLARRHGAFVVCGFPERDEGELFNAALVLDPEGRHIGHARKLHLNDDDRGWASPGDRWTVLRTRELGRLGVLIGSDTYVAESGTVMAIQRADVVAVPASWHGEIAGNGAIAIDPAINPHARRNAMVLWDEMAWGQQLYAVVANTAGSDAAPGGRSGVYSTDPVYGIDSRAFAGPDAETLVVSRFETLNGAHADHWIDQGHYVGSRRPGSLYYPLLAPSDARRSRSRVPATLAP